MINQMGQRDLNRLEKCAGRNLKVQQRGKCKVLNLERNNPVYQYMLWANWLGSRLVEKHLRISVDTKLSVSQQHALAIKNVNSLLRCTRKSTASRSKIVIIPLLSALVRPHLECWVQFCASQYNRDTDMLD